MKSNKKILFSTLIILLILTISVNFYSYKTIKKIKTFNTKEIIDNISYLSSHNFNGRLSGSFENLEASYYIKNYFKKLNLLPYKDDYFHSFQITYPKENISKNYDLSIIDNKQTIKSFNYGIDYKEDFLNFGCNSIEFNNKDTIYLLDQGIRILKDGKNVIIYCNDDSSLDFRSSFIEDSPIALVITVTKATLRDITENLSKGYTVSCSIPYSLVKTDINNVAAYIQGKDPSKSPIVISAHFDHLGKDLNGTIYHGALDNASGTSFILALAKYLKNLGTPDRDIIFVAFNGEEFGLKGSSAFISENLEELKNSKVFNFDMVGATNNIPISIMGGSNDNINTPLIKEFSNILKANKNTPNYIFEDASDHALFRKNDIEAITITNNDISKIHTPDDSIKNIDKTSLEKCFNLSSQEIINNAFKENIFIKHPYFLNITSSLLLTFVIAFLIISYIKKRR